MSRSYIKMEPQYEGPLKYYVTLCKKGILLPGRKLERCSKPKISVIIPMYNEEKNALTIIRSVQNQTMQEIEIVCVNDNSNDKTLEILKSLQKIDIVHYQTCGCKYLDNGEMDNFYLFNSFNIRNFYQVIKQPEIRDNYLQKKKHVTGSAFVFDKIYSRPLIERIADYIGPHIWNQHLIFVDDFLLAFAAMRMTDSIVNTGLVGYFHFMDTVSSTTSRVFEFEGYRLKDPDKTNKKLGDYMIILERILELTDDDKESLEMKEDTLRHLVQDQYLPSIARSVHFDKFLSLLEKLYNWKYITEDAKKRINKYVEFSMKYWVDPEKKLQYILEEKD